MTENIKQSLRTFIIKEFLPGEDPDKLTDDAPLISGGILDSIATLKLIMHIEDAYGVMFEAHEADKEHLDTLNQIEQLIRSKQ